MKPILQINDKKAHILIWTISAIIFIAISVLDRTTLNISLGFDPHIFAMLSACVNSIVAVLLAVTYTHLDVYKRQVYVC